MKTRGEKFEGLLKIGQKVHSILYGGRDGVVYDIKGNQRPDTIRSIGGIMATGGSAQLWIVFDNGTQSNVPECIVRGVQWYIMDECASPEEINEMLEFEESETLRKKAEAILAESNRANRRADILRQYPYLTPAKGAKKDPATANIKKELTRAFPAIKFSVTAPRGSSINVAWELGPTTESVQKITSKYQEGNFDGMTDCYDYDKENVWPDVFGGARYVFENRNYGNDLYEVVAKDLCTLCNMTYTGMYQSFTETGRETLNVIVYRLLNKTDLTSGYHGVRRTEEDCGQWEDIYEVY